MNSKAKVIALEGPDKLGKTTQGEILSNLLNNAIYQKLPYDDNLTFKKIYTMMKNGDALKYPLYFNMLLSLNGMSWQYEVLPKLKKKYNNIIIDRWKLSSYVYGIASGLSDNVCNLLTKEAIEPDIYFLFGGNPMQEYEENNPYEKNEFQSKIRIEYNKIISLHTNVVKINANNDINSVTKQLIEKINIL